jgi:hypothetical protein
MTSSTNQNTQEPESIVDVETLVPPAEPVPEGESANLEPRQAAKPVDKRTESEKLQSAINGTSYKDQPTLLALKRRLERLALAEATDQPPTDTIVALSTLLDQRLSEYDNWQKKQVLEVEQDIAKVSVWIAEGKITEAQSQVDRSHNQLKRINSDDQARLIGLIAPLREELARLLDWKKFASSEKKKELIEKITTAYFNAFGIELKAYTVNISKGTSQYHL